MKNTTMTTITSLQELFAIPGWGAPNYCGDYYTIKFCYKNTADNELQVLKLKGKYPHLYVHRAKTGNILFGGRFHKNEPFLTDRQLVMNGGNIVVYA
jgi:hypothetical protein